MTEADPQKIIDAAGAVIAALQPLSPEERSRVLHAASALFGVTKTSGVLQSGGWSDNETNDPEANHAPAPRLAAKRQSIVEFLNERQPATNTQRIACFAYYREHVDGKGSSFSKDDLEPFFALSKLPKPGNYDRDFGKVVRMGWIHEDGATSYLTQGGEDAVKAGFAGKAQPRGAAGTKKKKSATDT
jgi:hypothetical protein